MVGCMKFVVSGRGVEGVIDRFRPGALIVVAGERSDIALAAGLAYLHGTKLAGLLLTCGTRLSTQVEGLLRSAALAGLPILLTKDDTFVTGTKLASLGRPSVCQAAIRVALISLRRCVMSVKTSLAR